MVLGQLGDAKAYQTRVSQLQGSMISRSMNVSEAHVVVVAKDSGIPPRETSVPVVVHFPNHRASELKAKEDEAFTLMVVFGLVLSVAFIVILMMAVYIW